VAQGCALVAGEQAFGSNQLWVQESDMTRSSRSSPPHASLDAEDAEAALQTFVAKFDVPHQRLIGEVRASLRRRFPAANELVYDNYNFFVIGYSPTDRPSDALLSIAASAKGVSLCFIHGASLADPAGLLLGSGKQTRFLRVDSAKELDRADVERLLAAAVDGVEASLREGPAGTLIIRSVSAKQRGRRKSSK
jgi:hypothetical protein